jgi:cell division protein FtsZ
MNPVKNQTSPATQPAVAIKILGAGGAGGRLLEALAARDPGLPLVALNTDASALAALSVPRKILLGRESTRGLGAGGDPERGKAAVDEVVEELESVCRGAGVVLVLAGLGGGTGTGAAPVLARAAKTAGAVALAVVTLPFEFEGSRRQRQALAGLDRLKAAADAVICVPNQSLFRLVERQATLLEGFRIINGLICDGVQGIVRLLTRRGLLNIDFADLRNLVQGRQAESCLAAAEAAGPNRAAEVADRLINHPLLDEGEALDAADAVLVSLVGGPDLTMAAVNEVMDRLNRRCEGAQVLIGAVIDPEFADRLAVTLVTAQHAGPPAPSRQSPAAEPDGESPTAEELRIEGGFRAKTGTAAVKSRIVPPPPELTPGERDKMLAQNGGGKVPRKRAARWRQTQLPLEIISKGRFEKSEPTIHHGEDLDIPTYIRRGVSLN